MGRGTILVEETLFEILSHTGGYYVDVLLKLTNHVFLEQN